MENKTLELTGSGTTVAGYVKWQVVNQDGSIDREGEHKNLILDAGLDQLAITQYCNVFTYVCVGEGNSTPIVSQIGLDNETARSNAYLISPTGSCGSSYTSNIFTLKRTFNIPYGVLNGTYYELGFSWTATRGNNLWSRSLFKDVNGDPTGVVVSSAQQLRVVYQLIITYGSTTWQDGTVNITGIGAILYKYRAYQPLHDTTSLVPSSNPLNSSCFSSIMYISTTGNPDSTVNQLYGEPAMTSASHVSLKVKYRDATNYPNYTNWPPLNHQNSQYNGISSPSADATASTNFTRAPYVPGTFYLDRTGAFDVNTANGDIQWILSGQPHIYGSFTNWGCPDVYFLETPIPKDNLHTLTLVFRQTWGRA